MDFDSVFENICGQIACLSRDQLLEGILHYEGRIKLDFTEAYLAELSDDQLRHILMAAFLTETKKQPA